MIGFKDSRLKAGLFKPLYKPDFINTRCLRRQRWCKNAGKNYSQYLQLITGVSTV